MHPTGWFRSFALIILIAMFCITLAAEGSPAAIQQKLSTQIKLTRTTADRTDIVTAGDVVVIHKPGLLMYAVASPMPPTNTYKGGKILRAGVALEETSQSECRGMELRPTIHIAPSCRMKNAGSPRSRSRKTGCCFSFTAIPTTMCVTTPT